MRAATDLFQRVAQQIEKLTIRPDNRALQIEFDHGLSLLDCLEDIQDPALDERIEHPACPCGIISIEQCTLRPNGSGL
ncbi:hypothetical protein SDC9_208378 [bioreactor metagenome]|uniref:Uncharacterized protein n=1 Tax=bioreactor metagenome TaxID=1076179 RepID=A0A645JBD1_9ZZZZ